MILFNVGKPIATESALGHRKKITVKFKPMMLFGMSLLLVQFSARTLKINYHSEYFKDEVYNNDLSSIRICLSQIVQNYIYVKSEFCKYKNFYS